MLDLVIYSGIPSILLDILDTDDLSSDHSPLILSDGTFLPTERESYGTTSESDIASFKYSLDKNININIRVKDYAELDSANLGHQAAFRRD